MRDQTLVIDWSKYIKIYNGNHGNTLSTRRWKGYSSYLRGSSKGREKLENIRQLLNKYSLDSLGVKELNIKQITDNANVVIEG